MRNEAIIILVLALILSVSCQDAGKPSNTGEIFQTDYRGDCLSVVGVVTDSGYMELVVDGHTLNIYHHQAYYSCCLDYRVNYDIQIYDIVGRETDLAEQCRCDCTFDLRSELQNLDAGSYTVTLIGISGDTIGVDTAIIRP